MASAPELAPEDQIHMLRTSSVIQSIQYGNDYIEYSKFDAASTEKFEMGAWQPGSVSGGKMEWNAETKVLVVRSDAATVTLRK